MCDPITLLLGGLSAMSGLMGLMQPAPPDPPAAEVPAVAAPTNRNPGAIVRLGENSDDIQNNLDPNQRGPTKPFVEERTSGFSLGNLGKSGLTL